MTDQPNRPPATDTAPPQKVSMRALVHHTHAGQAYEPDATYEVDAADVENLETLKFAERADREMRGGETPTDNRKA